VASRSLTIRAFRLGEAAADTATATSTSPTTPSASLLRAWRSTHRSPISAMAVDASGGLVATGSADAGVRVWDADGGFCTHAFAGHAGPVTALAFHPADLALFSGGADGTVRGWDLGTRTSLWPPVRGHVSPVTALVAALPPPRAGGWFPAGGPAAPPATAGNRRQCLLLSAGRDGVAAVWDAGSGSKVAEVPVMEAVEGAVILAPACAALIEGGGGGGGGGGKGAAAPAGCCPPRRLRSAHAQ